VSSPQRLSYGIVCRSVLALVVLPLSLACASNSGDGGEAAAGGSGAIAQNARISTPQGTLLVSDVEHLEAFPPNCSVGAGCYKATAGNQLIAVWLTPDDDADKSALTSHVSDVFGDVSLLSDSGNQTSGTGGGLISGRLFVLFAPPASERSWLLSWPGNAAIALPAP